MVLDFAIGCEAEVTLQLKQGPQFTHLRDSADYIVLEYNSRCGSQDLSIVSHVDAIGVPSSRRQWTLVDDLTVNTRTTTNVGFPTPQELHK